MTVLMYSRLKISSGGPSWHRREILGHGLEAARWESDFPLFASHSFIPTIDPPRGVSEAHDEAESVGIDEKGRVAIPKRVRDRLGITPDEKLHLWVEDGEIHISPIVRKPTRIRAKRKWGKESFVKAGEALFADEE